MKYTDYSQFDTVPRDKYAAPKRHAMPDDPPKRGYVWCETCRCMVRPVDLIHVGKVGCLKCYVERKDWK